MLRGPRVAPLVQEAVVPLGLAVVQVVIAVPVVFAVLVGLAVPEVVVAIVESTDPLLLLNHEADLCLIVTGLLPVVFVATVLLVVVPEVEQQVAVV